MVVGLEGGNNMQKQKKCGCGSIIKDKRYKSCIDCELKMFNRKVYSELIKAKCSNCGYENVYRSSEYQSSDVTLCRNCDHVLTVCPKKSIGVI